MDFGVDIDFLTRRVSEDIREILASLALFEVALFATDYRPKAVFTVAWGNAPGM
jgi:hypothetical protein